MPRGDGREEYRFADGEDDSEDLGYGGGGGAGGGGRAKYDDDDEDEGGWATHRETDDLWDSTDEADEEEPRSRRTRRTPLGGPLAPRHGTLVHLADRPLAARP
jgi:hypothetical protein